VLADFTLETFSAHLDEDFTVTVPDGARPLALRLVEASSLGPSPAEGLRAPFSLVFRGPADRPLPQQMHPVAHPAIGSFDLFLVPVQPDAEGARYEAVFA
jgi:hypothetical protein